MHFSWQIYINGMVEVASAGLYFLIYYYKHFSSYLLKHFYVMFSQIFYGISVTQNLVISAAG